MGKVRASVQGGGGGMWSRHTFLLARLEPTRTGVGSPGAKMEGGGKKTRTRGLHAGGGRWRGESEIRQNQGQTKRGLGQEGEGSEGE